MGTCLDHPRSGKTQLFRRNVTLQELRAILADPRHHTWKGYYRRHSAQRPEPSPGGALRAGGPHLECSIDSALDYPTLTYSTTVQQRLEAVWPGQDAVLALNEDGYTLVDADLADGDGLPPSLAQLLRRRRRRRRAPVDYVALDSSSDSWFVQFTSSKWEADVCDSLRRALESKAGVDVEVLAFAPHGGW